MLITNGAVRDRFKGASVEAIKRGMLINKYKYKLHSKH